MRLVFFAAAVYSSAIFPIVHIMFSVPLFKSLLLDGETTEWIDRNLNYKDNTVLETLISNHESAGDSDVLDALYSQWKILRAYEICEYVRSLESKFVYYPQAAVGLRNTASSGTLEEVLHSILDIFKEVAPLDPIRRAFEEKDIALISAPEYSDSVDYFETGMVLGNILYVHIVNAKCISITPDMEVAEQDCPHDVDYRIVTRYDASDALNAAKSLYDCKKKSVELLQMVQALIL